MDKSKLAHLMLEYEDKYNQLKEMEQAIEDAILQLQETQIVGNVEAKYRTGRKSYKYEEAVESKLNDGIFSQEEVDQAKILHTKIRESVSWSKIVKELDIPKEEIPYDQGEPSVYIKVKENK